MAEEGESVPAKAIAEGPVGKVEANPAHPEVKTGTVGIKIFVAEDGFVFTNREQAIAYGEALRTAKTGK